MSGKLEQSKKDGAHALLASMVGEWRGVARTWFEPGKLADESPIAGSTRLVLDGMFLLHEYEGTLQDAPMKGIAIIGYSLAEQQWQVSWIDSIHNGTRIMHSTGTVPNGGLSPSSADAEVGDASASASEVQARKQGQSPKSGTVPSVLGSYPAGEGPDWGWRTTLEMRGRDNLVISHYNITPGGEESIGVEIDYKRSRT